MKREIITTADGSKTIHIPEWNEQYHSKHGAIQEAQHVFLQTGLQFYMDKSVGKAPSSISILEIGFGTGLNALLTFFKARALNVTIDYVGVEAFPVSFQEAEAMDYASQIRDEQALAIYKDLHTTDWEKEQLIANDFRLTKQNKKFEDIIANGSFDLVYFDAFGPRVQPELWTEAMFEKMYTALKPNGVLTTYCAQGAARRAMQASGLIVERLPGPPGKREMLRATKTIK